MDKKEVIQFLTDKGIDFYVVEHPVCYTVEDVDALDLPEREAETKNLFLCDDKKRNYYLLTMTSHKRANLSALRHQFDSERPLRFASESDLMELLGLTKGSVTALGVLNDEDCTVKVYFDRYFEGGRIAVHPMSNDATAYLNTDDLVRLIKDHGNRFEYINLE